jgi:hypothetical protein
MPAPTIATSARVSVRAERGEGGASASQSGSTRGI